MRAERRHALHHDQFVEGVVTLGQRAAKHARSLIIIAVGIVAIIALAFYSSTHARARAETSWNELEAATARLDQVMASPESPQTAPLFEQAVKACRDVATQYPEQPAGQMALLRAGDALFERERYDEAAAAYRELLSRPTAIPEFKRSAQRALAATLEQKGDYEAAAALYGEALNGVEGALRAEILWDEGRCLQEAGKQEQAKSAYSEVIRLAPQSLFGQMAAARLEAGVAMPVKATAMATAPALDSNARAVDTNAAAKR